MSGMHRRLVVVAATIGLTGCLAALPLGANNGKGHGHNPHATTTTRATTTTVKPTTTTGGTSSTSTSLATTTTRSTTTTSSTSSSSTSTSAPTTSSTTSSTTTTVPSTAWRLQTSSGHPNLFTTLTSADGNAYTAQTNEWGVTGSCSPWPTLTIGGTGVEMTVLGSLINQGNGCAVCQFCPGAYPSIFRTTKAYNETVTALQTAGTVTTSVGTDTSKVAAGDGWDDAYDIWFSSSSTGSCPSGCMELMIWLDRHNEYPAGSFRQTVTLDGISWDEYYNGTKTVSFVAHTPRSSVTGLDLGPFANESVNLGAMADTWVLNNVSMGFELWTGGANLAMTSPFQVCVQGHGC